MPYDLPEVNWLETTTKIAGRNAMKKFTLLILFSIFTLSCAPEIMESKSEVIGEWHHAGGSHFSEKYAALDQINAENLSLIHI